MHVTLTPFKAEDACELLGKDAKRYIDILVKLEMDGPGYTGRIADGRVLGCAGMTELAPWVVDFWVIPGPLVKVYPIAFHKSVLVKFHALLETTDAHRIQAVVDPRYPERSRWCERLGFTKEATMRRFGPERQDMDLYAMIREDANGRT